MPDSSLPIRRDALTVAVLHAGLALYYWLGRGVTIVHDFGPEPWNWFWQNVPADLLRERALESLWHLHAQPPLWNALGAVFIKLFGGFHLPALQAFHIVLGSATAAVALALVARLTGRRGWGWAGGLAVALNPALFLFEAYALYTVVAAFTALLAAFLLAGAGREGSVPMATGFVVAVSALVLTRSLFHLVLLAGAVPLALLVAGRPGRRWGTVLLAAVLLPTGWYAKNQAQHGFFGASSWYGIGLFRSALFRADAETLERLLADGEVEDVVGLAPFSPPSMYRDKGYDRESRVPVLSRDDFHNVNVPAISDAYAGSAWTLIRRSPGRFLGNAVVAYGNFSAPSHRFAHLGPNEERMGIHADAWSWLLARPLFAAVEARWLEGRYYGSLYFLLIPAVLLLYAFQFTRGLRGAGALAERTRADACPFFMACLVAYTMVVGCTMELGENVRFKFLVEPLFSVLLLVVLYRLLSASGSSPTPTPGGNTDE